MLAWNEKIVSLQRRNGRAVECGGLENRCTAMYRGFESLFLRGDEATEKSLLFFIHESAQILFNFVLSNIDSMENNNSLSNRYSHSEEVANTISHLIGAIMGISVCSFFLLKAYQSGDSLSIFSLYLYFFGVVSSYLASFLYHACPAKKENSKLLLRKFDHAAIYWHIAGSYTPIVLIAMYLNEAVIWAFAVFSFIWICAILGTILTFRKIKPHSYFKTACYVVMGLSILVAFKPLYESVGLKVVLFIIAEGLSYIIGAIFYSFKKTKYMHSVFHVFVVFGDVFHMLAVWNVIKMYLYS